MKQNLHTTAVVFLVFGCIAIIQSCEDNLTTQSTTNLVGSSATKTTSKSKFLTITDCNWTPWIMQLKSNNANVYTAIPPLKPPLGSGSLFFDAPDKKFCRLGFDDFVGKKIADISALSFSTFIVKHDSTRDNVFLTIQIDTTNDGLADVPLIFTPYYQSGIFVPAGGLDQGPLALNTWQTWDALKGYWWLGDFVNDPVDPEHLGRLYTLPQLRNKYPKGTIYADQFDGTGLSIRFAAGGAAFGRNFLGCVDNFHIAIKSHDETWDFEDCP